MLTGMPNIDKERVSARQWFALRVRSRCEKVVASAVRLKGYEEFLPLARNRQRWSDRIKSVDIPLFPGYVFCKIALEQRLPLLTIPGVLGFVGVGRTPVAIAEPEIASIQCALHFGVNVEPWGFVEAGTRVKLSRGPLAGVEGFLVRSGERNRMVLGVTLLRQAVALEVGQKWLDLQEVCDSAAAS
jgi:transcription antitermination factor NusG